MATLVPALLVIGLWLTACGGGDGAGVTLGKKIAFLLPDTQARYESQDLPFFTAKLKSLCSDCTVDYRNAHQDAATQLTQAQAALAGGATVLVLDPVDVSTASAIGAKAKARHVPVIAYDRLVVNTPDVAYSVGFDDSAVGPLQADALLTALKGKANPTVVALSLGAQDMFGTRVTIAKAYDTPQSSPEGARTEMTDALTALHNKVDAVYAADDATAGGATAALLAAGIKPFPLITGNGAELKAIQRILVGQQYMTVYKPVRAEAESAAQLAYDLAYGVALPSSMTEGRVLITPQAVTRQTIISTVIADGFWTRAEICTGEYAAGCAAAGIR